MCLQLLQHRGGVGCIAGWSVIHVALVPDQATARTADCAVLSISWLWAHSCEVEQPQNASWVGSSFAGDKVAHPSLVGS